MDMKTPQSIVSPLDKFTYTLTKNCVFLSESQNKVLKLYFEDDEVFEFDQLSDCIFELIKLLHTGPCSKEKMEAFLLPFLGKKEHVEQFLMVLQENHIIQKLSPVQANQIVHRLTNDIIFREKEISSKTPMVLEESAISLPKSPIYFPRSPSLREFSSTILSLGTLSSILYNGYGHSNEERNQYAERPVPSAGGLYDLEILVFVNFIEGLKKGCYNYYPSQNKLIPITHTEFQIQDFFSTKHIQYSTASFVVMMTSKLSKYSWRYGKRGYRFALFEAGHVAQNMILAAEKNSVKTVPVGAHNEEVVKRFIHSVFPSQTGWGNAILYTVVFGK